MRRIVYEAFGEAEVIHLVRAPVPEPGPNDVRLQVVAAGLNPIDWKTRRGLGFVAQQIGDKLPWTPGFEVSGTVTAVGADVRDWKLGDRACGMVGFPLGAGGYAEQVVTAADRLCQVPENLDMISVGGLPLAGLTAWQGLFEHGKLKSGDKILIHAGAGGVGHLAIQLAKTLDVHVIATASDENIDFLTGLGADEVIDYHNDDFVEECYGLDLVLDLVGGEVGRRSVHTLATGGTLVTVPTNTADAVIAAAEKQGLHAVNFTVRPDTEQLESMLELMEQGDLRVHVEAEYHLGDAAAAQRRLEEGHVRGKLVLVPGDS